MKEEVETDLPSFNKAKISPLKINKCNEVPPENRLFTPRAAFKEVEMPSNIKSCSPLKEEPMHSSKSMIFDLTYMGEKKRKGSKNLEKNSSQSKIASEFIIVKEKTK